VVTVLRWWGTPGPWEVGRRREPVIKMSRRWPCKGWRRPSVSREVKHRWRTSESWWRQIVLSFKTRRWGKAWRGALLSNVLRGDGGIKHLRRRASLAHWSEGWWWWSSGWHNILRKWSRRRLLLWRRLAAWPLVLIWRVCCWRWDILLVAVSLHGRRTSYRGRNMDGWRGSLHRRGA